MHLISERLRKLTRSSQPWEQQRAFNLLKDRLCENIVNHYFDPTRHSTVVCDGSPVGVEAALYQTDDNEEMRLRCFVSRALTAVEQRYSQTCRDATAVVYACERLHQYLYNSDFTLLSDHLPLKTIFGNPSAKLPVRLERLSLRLQPYRFTFGHVAGKHNPSDYYSRHTVDQPGDDSADVAEQYVAFIANSCVLKFMTLAEIASETLNDPVMSQIIKCIESDDWRPVADKVKF